MAKLSQSKGKPKASSQTNGQKSPSDIPLSTPSTNKLMPPPASRPQVTPAHAIQSNATPQTDTGSAAKKRKKRSGRGKKNRGSESFSENATTNSENTSRSSVQPQLAQPMPNIAQNKQSRAVSSSPRLSQAQQAVFQSEPERFGKYAFSDAGISDSEQENSRSSGSRQRAPTYSPDVDRENEAAVESEAGDVDINLDSEGDREVNGEATRGTDHPKIDKPQIRSDVAASYLSSDKINDISQGSSSMPKQTMPEPKKLSNGNWACPFAREHNCNKTYDLAINAREHGESHLHTAGHKFHAGSQQLSRKQGLKRHLENHEIGGLNPSQQIGSDEQPIVESGRGFEIVQEVTDSVPIPDDSDIAIQTLEYAGEVTDAEPEPMTEEDNNSATEDETETDEESMKAKTNAKSLSKLSDTQPHDDETDTSSTDDDGSSSTTSRATSEPVSLAKINGVKRQRPSPAVTTSSLRSTRPRKRARRNDVATSSDVYMEDAPRQSSESSSAIPVHNTSENVADVSHWSKHMARPQRNEAQMKAQSPSKHSTSTPIATDVEETATVSNGKPDTADDAISDTDMDLSNETSVLESASDSGSGDESSSESNEDSVNGNPNDALSELSRPAKQLDKPLQAERRQLSLDGFVRRGEKSSDASGPSKQKKFCNKIQLKAQTSLVEKRTTTDVLKKQTAPAVSTTNAEAKAHSSTESDSEFQQEQEGRVQALPHEQTSSEDRPRATTFARRTSSVSSKAKGKRPLRHLDKPPADDNNKDGSEYEDEVDNAKHSKSTSKKRTSRPSGEKMTFKEASTIGKTGRLSEDERAVLFAWQESFCEEHSLTKTEFNDMMTMRKSTKWMWKFITRADFIQEFYDQLPDRNRRSLLRFRERNFQNVEKGPWTDDEDTELQSLVSQLGKKWVEVGEMMGRTADSVQQRWRHRLNDGKGVRAQGEWTTEELTQLEEEIVAFATAKGTTADDDDLVVPWHAISEKLGTGRTAQQCANRWRVSTTRRIRGKFVKVPLNDRIPGSLTKAPRTPSKMSNRLSGGRTTGRQKIKQAKRATTRSASGKQYKSAERIDPSDEDENESEHVTQKEDAIDVKQDGADTDLENEASADDNTSSDEASDDSSDMETERESGNSEATKSQHKVSNARDKDAEKDSEHDEDVAVAQGKDVIVAPHHTPPPTSTVKLFSQTQAGQRTKPKQKVKTSTYKRSQASTQSAQSPEATPVRSKNPLKSAKTPDNNVSFTQIFEGTQGNTSVLNGTAARSVKSLVPDSVVPNRPSPKMNIERRPRSSPLQMLSSTAKKSKGRHVDDEEPEQMGVDTTKSPRSFVSARDGATSSTDQSDEDDSDASGSVKVELSDSGSDPNEFSDDDTASEAEIPPRKEDSPPPSSFWQAVNSMTSKILHGTQRNGSQMEKHSQKKPKHSLADALKRGQHVNDSGEDDDDDD